MQIDDSGDDSGAAKVYTSIKNRNSLIAMLFSFVLLLTAAFSGISNEIANFAEFHFSNNYIQFIIFVFIFGTGFSLLELPFSFYNGYIIEHQFGLSNQTIRGWIFENLKSTLLMIVFIVPVAAVFYYMINAFGTYWWFFFALFVFLFSLFTSWIAPVLLFPLFYTFKPIENETLRDRLITLTKETNLRIKNVFSFNLSKNTRKANAALAGFGRTKRIIIADTLLENFTDDEIYTVFAHEMGHYRLKHIPINSIISFAVIMTTFAACDVVFRELAHRFGYISITQLAALPMLLFFLSVFSFIMAPLLNVISRHFESAADRYAVTHTRDPESYISALNKLAALNLSDREPGALYEFLFYSHPPISKRIKAIRGS